MQLPVKEVKIENGRLVYELAAEAVQPVKEEVKVKDPEMERMLAEEKIVKRRERCVKLSIIGLITSVLAGIGIIFSVMGIVDGIIIRKRDALLSRSAITLGVVGCILSVLFAVLVGCVISVLLY
ncbi:MAG: hypothetical protein IKC36_00350 [Clostridia bacterium]|nr:hypothetical protein [Clostridia bacterium]